VFGMTGGTLPTAPSGPARPDALATTARGTAPPPIDLFTVPGALGDLLHYYDPPAGFSELLGALGADPEVPTDVFLAIPEADFVDALSSIEVEGRPLTSVGRARVIVQLRAVFVTCGRAVPGLGAVPAAPAAASAARAAIATAVPPTLAEPPIVAPAASVNLAQIVDQSIKGTTRRLTLAELRDYRVQFENVTGASPPERTLPTSDQLAGLRTILEPDLPPYVDFAVWPPMGLRAAKFQRTDATVLIAGAFVTRTLDAPSSYDAWEDSWALFANAMVSLNAARPGSLCAYLDGIKTLHRHFPHRWSTILATDLLVRSERWMRVREDIERGPHPLGYDARAPWDYVICACAYGRDGPLSRWWQDEVVLPMSLSSGRPPLHEGLPGPASSGGALSARGAAPPRASPARQKPKAPKAARPANAKETCNSYNMGTGACRDGGAACKWGRRHVCSMCGDKHQAYKSHTDYTPPADSKPKGGGRGQKRKQ